MTTFNDDLAFINSIVANPEDDTVRLVYADWLDEYSTKDGKPRHDRAELIRLQIQMSHELVSVPGDARRVDDLIEANPAWKPPCPICDGDAGKPRDFSPGERLPRANCFHCSQSGLCPCEFRRGFVWSVTVPKFDDIVRPVMVDGPDRQSVYTGSRTNHAVPDYAGKMEPSFWSDALLRHCPTVEQIIVEEFEPWRVRFEPGWAVWDGSENGRGHVPQIVFEEIKRAHPEKLRQTYEGGGIFYLIFAEAQAAIDAVSIANCITVKKYRRR